MSGERLTEAIYMVAAGRFLVGRESLHKLPTFDFAKANIKVELMANDLGQIFHSIDRAEQVGRIHDLDGALFRFLECIILTVSNTYIDAGGYAHE